MHSYARRKFDDALDNDDACANHPLQEIKKVYAIERSCKEQGLAPDQVLQIRQEQSIPILIALRNCFKEPYIQALQKSVIGDALAYSIKGGDRLMICTTNGNVNIDNNPLENSIRSGALIN
jgi:transposase